MLYELLGASLILAEGWERLSASERERLLRHTEPDRLLTELVEEYAAARAFLQMASDTIRHHHERHDGTGYPERLADRRSRWRHGSWRWPMCMTRCGAGVPGSQRCRTRRRCR
jgi:hypothetical protein